MIRRLLLPAALGVALAAAPARAAVVEEIVAKVNNRIITKSEFEERGEFILRDLYRQYSGEELDLRLKEAQDTMLASMITEALLLEKAAALTDLDKARANLIDDFKKQQKIESDEELDRLLREQGMTRKDLEEQLLRLAIPQEIVNYEVRRNVSVSDREVRERYEATVKDYETPPTATFREIVILYEPATRAEAEMRAAAARREIEGGADFAELVGRYSQAGTREAGGLLGPLAATDLQKTIARAVFALEPGEVSDPIDTGQSFHIMRLEGKTPRVVKPLEQVHDEIYNALRQEKFRPLYEAYLRRLWRENVVEVMPKYEIYLVTSPLKGAPGARPAPASTPAPEAPRAPGSVPAGDKAAPATGDGTPPAGAPPAPGPEATPPPPGGGTAPEGAPPAASGSHPENWLIVGPGPVLASSERSLQSATGRYVAASKSR